MSVDFSIYDKIRPETLSSFFMADKYFALVTGICEQLL